MLGGSKQQYPTAGSFLCVNTFIQPWGAGTLSPMTASVTGARFRVLSSSVINSGVPETGPPRPGSSLELFQPPRPALSLLSPHSRLSFFSLESLCSHTVCSRHSLLPRLLLLIFPSWLLSGTCQLPPTTAGTVTSASLHRCF